MSTMGEALSVALDYVEDGGAPTPQMNRQIAAMLSKALVASWWNAHRRRHITTGNVVVSIEPISSHIGSWYRWKAKILLVGCNKTLRFPTADLARQWCDDKLTDLGWGLVRGSWRDR